MNDGRAPWIKVVTQIFEDPKMIAIGELPDGNAITLIWLKILCLAGEQNRGGAIYFTESVPFTPELLAAKWRCKPATVQFALTAFQKLGMIGIDKEGTIFVLNWSKYQNEAGLARIRERNLKQLDQSPESAEEGVARKRERDAERQRRRRKKLKRNDSNGAVTRHAPVTRDSVTAGVTVTLPSRDSSNDSPAEAPETQKLTNVTSRARAEIENKNKTLEEPHIIPQRGIETDDLQREIHSERDSQIETNSPPDQNFEQAKQWVNSLFGRQRVWNYEESELLSRLLPISREDRALLSWAYTLPRNAEGWAMVDGDRVNKPKSSSLILLREFSGEIDKWKSVRANLNGADDDYDLPRGDGWTAERVQVRQEDFPDVTWPERFDSVPIDVQRQIDRRARDLIKKMNDGWTAERLQVRQEDFPDATWPERFDLVPIDVRWQIDRRARELVKK
jgi:predicted phage replisome organizer